MSNNLLSEHLSAPLNGTKTANIDIDSAGGNLHIDQLPEAEPVLASGTLEYFEKQGRPAQSVSTDGARTTLTVKGSASGQPWFRFPWVACTGATEWQIHLNPTVAADIAAHTGGGNVNLNLAGMVVSSLSAETGGGNVELVLPEHAANLHVGARTGGGNITVEIGSQTRGSNTVDASSGAGKVVVMVPRGLAARVHAKTGLGKVTVEPVFAQIDDHTYQSSDYETAADTVELSLSSGAGTISVNEISASGEGRPLK